MAINDNVHILYRAMGRSGLSVLGYASSKNGINFDEKNSKPVYVANNFRKLPKRRKCYMPMVYPSGGGWGGCEDPRAVAIDGRFYVSFSAFDGWDFIRMAVISISEEDFLEKNFKLEFTSTLFHRRGRFIKIGLFFQKK